MKATICVQGDRAETYSDVMAALVGNYPKIEAFDFTILNDQDGEALLRKIETDLASCADLDAYIQAGRRARESRREIALRKSTFKRSDIIDVTGVSKELMAEILPIAMTTGKPVCSLSWSDRINKNRKFVGKDNYVYFNTMNSSIVLEIYRSQRAVWLIFYILAIIICGVVGIYAASFAGIDVIPDKLINLLDALVGLGGLFLSYVALKLVPTQPGNGPW